MRLLRAALPQWRALRSSVAVDASGVSTSSVPSCAKEGGIIGTKGTHLLRKGSEEGYSGLRILPYDNGLRRTHASTVEGLRGHALDFDAEDAPNSTCDERTGVAVRVSSCDSVTSPWPSGTWDDPVPITSVTSSRAVACCGPPDGKRPHATVWVNVTETHPVQCPTCRQVFKLSRRQS